MKHKTPDDLKLHARDVHFDFLSAMKQHHYWHDNDPVVTHFFNALQATFPEGERFFIEAVRDVRDQMEPGTLPQRLLNDIKLFIRQEGFHGREHEQWTQALIEMGYSGLAEFDAKQKKLREWGRRKFDPLSRLGSTVAMEHFTAIIGSLVLYKRPDLIENAVEPFRSALIYHTLEEVEHKAVCYELFKAAGGNYPTRLFGLFVSILGIMYQVRARHIYLLEQDGLWNKQTRRRARQFVWGRNGIVIALLPKVIEYLHPNFHPWATDEREDFIRMFGHYLEASGIAA